MPIRVTCSGCHTRFNVSDKFAGREGPCPKCKKQIRIPNKTEEVVVHTPDAGPKDAKGKSILKPIVRKETNLSGIQIAIIACTIVGFLILSLLMRTFFTSPEEMPGWLFWFGAIALAVPLCFAGYTFLRDQELGIFAGQELWMRILSCAAVYALLWTLVPLMNYAFVDMGQTGAFVALGVMLVAGAGAATLALDLDYLNGLMHVGLYLSCCLLCRFLTGVATIPGGAQSAPTRGTRDRPAVVELLEMFDAMGVTLSSWGL